MATLAENKRDAEIIDAILAVHPYLGGKRSPAVRVALEFWWEAHQDERAQTPRPEARLCLNCNDLLDEGDSGDLCITCLAGLCLREAV